MKDCVAIDAESIVAFVGYYNYPRYHKDWAT